MRTKSRSASIYIFFTSVILFVGVGYLSLILHKGHVAAKEELSNVQRQLENGEINIYDNKGRLDPLVIENIYRYHDTIDYIILYRQKNILATGGSEPAVSIDDRGIRQYQHYWWQKVVRTYFPDPLHDQNYSVDMVVDIVPQSVLKNALLSCVMMLGALLFVTVLYSAAYSSMQKKKREAEKKASEKDMPVPLVAETQTAAKGPVSMDVPIETILGPQVVDEFFSGLDLIEEQEAERLRRGESGYGEYSSSTPAQASEDEDSGFFDTELNETDMREDLLLAVEDETLPDLPVPDELEISDEENLDELLPEVVAADEISETLDIVSAATPDIDETESAEDLSNEVLDLEELPELPDLAEDDAEAEIAEEESAAEETADEPDNLEELPELPDLVEDDAEAEIAEEESAAEETADEPDNLEELPELPDLAEDDAETEIAEEESAAEESFPELAEPLSEEERQQEEIDEELPVLDDEDEISEETQEQDTQTEESAEDLIPIEDLAQELAEEDELAELEDLPQLEDLLGPNSVAREDDADDIEDLPNLDNLLMAEEMEEKGLSETSSPAAIELSDNMLQELTSTPDVGLKNLSSDSADDDFDAVLADIEAESDETYLPSFETDSPFPEPPLLKGMSAARKPAKAQPAKKPLRVPVLLEPEKEELPKGIFQCTAAELEEAVKKTDWKESLSSILLDAEEMEEDFSLLIFALADEEAGKSVVNKYFTQEHGLTLHRFSEHSFGIWLINTDLEGAYGIAGEFVYFMEEQRLVTAVGLSAKSDRLVRSEHLVKEASHALSRAITSGGGIVGFRSDPRKYARVTVGK